MVPTTKRADEMTTRLSLVSLPEPGIHSPKPRTRSLKQARTC